MKKKIIFTAVTCICLLATACGATAGSTVTTPTPTAAVSAETVNSSSGINATGTSNTGNAATTVQETETVHAKDAEEARTEISNAFSITTEDGSYTQSGNTYTITAAGTYTLTGLLEEGSIVVNAGSDDKVNLDLNDVKITNSSTSPITVLIADKVKIKSIEGTYNEIVDSREPKTDDDEDSTVNAAIFSKADLDLTGKGTLVVSSTYNNGIQSKDSISVKNVTLKITAANNALRGNDSVEIESGEITLIAKGGDGIKTSNSDVSSKGNQRGIVTISGGNLDIYACCDGIDAAYDAVITTEGSINIYTGKYSEYTEGKIENGTDFYIVVPSSVYTSTSVFCAYFYNDDYSAGVWKAATYDAAISSGRTRYYGLKLSAPNGYENVQFFRFKNGTTPNTENYTGATTGSTFNTAKNAFLITSLDSDTLTLSGDYTQVTMNASSSNDKSVYSTKGITACNTVSISNATITVKCNDDGIHANNDVTLENNEKGIGSVTIESGTITVTASDDGIHADSVLSINGGNVNILASYEGLEGNVVNLNGGNVFIYASDDGINACSGSETPAINFNGGYADITTSSGDTDGVDSNGNINMTGGFVLVKGGNSQGMVAGSVDADGKITVTGGTVIALGGICEVPENSVNGFVAASAKFEKGSYQLKDAQGNCLASFELTTAYSNGWISSDLLKTGTSYTLYKDGSSVLSWTQESGTMNASSAGGFGGFGGPGGSGFPGRR